MPDDQYLDMFFKKFLAVYNLRYYRYNLKNNREHYDFGRCFFKQPDEKMQNAIQSAGLSQFDAMFACFTLINAEKLACFYFVNAEKNTHEPELDTEENISEESDTSYIDGNKLKICLDECNAILSKYLVFNHNGGSENLLLRQVLGKHGLKKELLELQAQSSFFRTQTHQSQLHQFQLHQPKLQYSQLHQPKLQHSQLQQPQSPKQQMQQTQSSFSRVQPLKPQNSRAAFLADFLILINHTAALINIFKYIDFLKPEYFEWHKLIDFVSFALDCRDNPDILYLGLCSEEIQEIITNFINKITVEHVLLIRHMAYKKYHSDDVLKEFIKKAYTPTQLALLWYKSKIGCVETEFNYVNDIKHVQCIFWDALLCNMKSMNLVEQTDFIMSLSAANLQGLVAILLKEINNEVLLNMHRYVFSNAKEKKMLGCYAEMENALECFNYIMVKKIESETAEYILELMHNNDYYDFAYYLPYSVKNEILHMFNNPLKYANRDSSKLYNMKNILSNDNMLRFLPMISQGLLNDFRRQDYDPKRNKAHYEFMKCFCEYLDGEMQQMIQNANLFQLDAIFSCLVWVKEEDNCRGIDDSKIKICLDACEKRLFVNLVGGNSSHPADLLFCQMLEKHTVQLHSPLLQKSASFLQIHPKSPQQQSHQHTSHKYSFPKTQLPQSPLPLLHTHASLVRGLLMRYSDYAETSEKLKNFVETSEKMLLTEHLKELQNSLQVSFVDFLIMINHEIELKNIFKYIDFLKPEYFEWHKLIDFVYYAIEYKDNYFTMPVCVDQEKIEEKIVNFINKITAEHLLLMQHMVYAQYNSDNVLREFIRKVYTPKQLALFWHEPKMSCRDNELIPAMHVEYLRSIFLEALVYNIKVMRVRDKIDFIINLGLASPDATIGLLKNMEYEMFVNMHRSIFGICDGRKMFKKFEENAKERFNFIIEKCLESIAPEYILKLMYDNDYYALSYHLSYQTICKIFHMFDNPSEYSNVDFGRLYVVEDILSYDTKAKFSSSLYKELTGGFLLDEKIELKDLIEQEAQKYHTDSIDKSQNYFHHMSQNVPNVKRRNKRKVPGCLEGDVVVEKFSKLDISEYRT